MRQSSLRPSKLEIRPDDAGEIYIREQCQLPLDFDAELACPVRPALPAPDGQGADGKQEDGGGEHAAARQCRRRLTRVLRAFPGVAPVVTGLPRRAGGLGATGVV